MRALLIASLLLLGCASAQTAAEPVAGRFTSFAGQTIEGRRFDLAPRLGTDVVFVSFWATWCEPCKAEMPVLQSLHDKYKDQGLTVVAVSIDGPDTAADVGPYIRRQGYTFPVLIDEDGAIAQRHNPAGTAPFSVVVARDGSVAKRVAGFQPSEAPELERELRDLMGLPADTTP